MKIPAYLKETFSLNAKLLELRDYSFVTFSLERFFLVLQQFTVLTWLIGSRKRAHDRCKTVEEWEALTKRRGKQVELYVVLYTPLLLLAMQWATTPSHFLRGAAVVLVGYRIFETVQAAVNVTLFDHFRITGTHRVSGVTRSVVLGLWNYLELIVCFGVIYAAHPMWLTSETKVNSYYFSAITQLTIGYGDVNPVGWGRVMAVLQGLTGLFFLVVVLARFVTLMPEVTSVQRGDRK